MSVKVYRTCLRSLVDYRKPETSLIEKCWKIMICLRAVNVVNHETRDWFGIVRALVIDRVVRSECLKNGFKLRCSETHELDVALRHEMQVRTTDLELMWVKTKNCSTSFAPGADTQGYEQKASRCEK